MQTEKRERLISDKQAADLFGCSRATFWRRVGDGTFPPPVKVGGLTRWSKTEIEAVIESALMARRAENEETRRRRIIK